MPFSEFRNLMTWMVPGRKFSFVPLKRFKQNKTLSKKHFVPPKRFRRDKM